MELSYCFPVPVLCEVLKKLSFKDLNSATKVCKVWKTVAECDVLWQFFAFRDFKLIEKDPYLSWKKWYRLMQNKNGRFSNFHLLETKIVLVWGNIFSIDEIVNYQHAPGRGMGKFLKTEHKGAITCSRIDMVRNLIRIITGSYDKTIKIFFKNYSKGRFSCSQTLEKHRGMVTTINFNASFLFSGSSDRTIVVWKQNNETLQYTYDQTLEGHQGPITAIYAYKDPFFPHFFSASTDKKIIYWLKEEGVFRLFQTLEGHQAAVTRLAVSLHDNQLISGDEAGVIKIWEQQNKQWACLHTIQAHSKPITSIRCQPYRGRFCTSGGNEVKLWKRKPMVKDWETAEKIHTTESHISELKMGHYVPETGSCELFLLTEKDLQLAWLDDTGISTSKKSIEFSN